MTKNLIKIDDFNFSFANRTIDNDTVSLEFGHGYMFYDDANLLGNILVENPENHELFISRNTKITKSDQSFSHIIKTKDNIKLFDYKKNTSGHQSELYTFNVYNNLYSLSNNVFSNKLLTNGKSINKISTYDMPYDIRERQTYNTYFHKNSNADYSHLFCLDKNISKKLGLLNIIENPNDLNEKYTLYIEQSHASTNGYADWVSGLNFNYHSIYSLVLYKGKNLNIDASNELNTKLIPLENNHYYTAGGNTQYTNTNISVATNPQTITATETNRGTNYTKITYTGTTLNKEFILSAIATNGVKILFVLDPTSTGSFFVTYNGVRLSNVIDQSSTIKLALFEWSNLGWYNITSLYKDNSLNPVNNINAFQFSNFSYITTDFVNKKMIFIKHDMPSVRAISGITSTYSPSYVSELNDNTQWNNNFNTPVNMYFNTNLFNDVKVPYQVTCANYDDSTRSQKNGNSNILQQRIGDGLRGYSKTDSRVGINYMGYLGQDNLLQHYYLNISNSGISGNTSSIKQYYSTNILRDFNKNLKFKNIPLNPTTTSQNKTISAVIDNYIMTVSLSDITEYNIISTAATGFTWASIQQQFTNSDIGKVIRFNITKTAGTYNTFSLLFNPLHDITFKNFVMAMTTSGYDNYNTVKDNKQIYPYKHPTADSVQNYHGVLLDSGVYSFEMIITDVNKAEIYNLNNLHECVTLNYNTFRTYDNPKVTNVTTALAATNQLPSVWKNYTYSLANVGYIYWTPLNPLVGDRFKISHIAGAGTFKVQYRNITTVTQVFDLTPLISNASAQKTYVFEWRGTQWIQVTDSNDIPGNNLNSQDFKILKNWTNTFAGNSMSYLPIPSKVEVNQSNNDLYHFYVPAYSTGNSVYDFMKVSNYFSPIIYNWNKSVYDDNPFEILDCNISYPDGTDWFTYGCLHNEIAQSKTAIASNSLDSTSLSYTNALHDNGQLYKYINHNFITKIGNRYFLNHCIFYGTNRNADLLVDNSTLNPLTTEQVAKCRRIITYEIDTSNWRNLTYQNYYEFDETQIAFLALDEDNFTKILVNKRNSLEILTARINIETDKFNWISKQKETGNFVQIALDNQKNIWLCTCDIDLDETHFGSQDVTLFNNSWTKPIVFSLYKLIDNSDYIKKYTLSVTSLLNFQYSYIGEEINDTLYVDIYDENNEKVSNINYALFLHEGIEGITFENDLRYIDNENYSGITKEHTLKINAASKVKLEGKILLQQ